MLTIYSLNVSCIGIASERSSVAYHIPTAGRISLGWGCRSEEGALTLLLRVNLWWALIVLRALSPL